MIQIKTNNIENKQIFINHIIPLEFYFKFSYAKIIKVQSIVILACKKFRQLTGGTLEISHIRSGLGEGLVEPGGIRKIMDLVEEHQTQPRAIRDTAVLPLFSNDGDVVRNFDQAWKKARDKHENIESHSLHFLKKERSIENYHSQCSYPNVLVKTSGNDQNCQDNFVHLE